MPNEQKEGEDIRRLITRWLTEIKLANASSYFDINKVAEGICRQLLNGIYGYELVDLNLDRFNYPGIDLGDRKAGIAFQVTARTDAKKIADTFDKYVRHDGEKAFPAGVRFLIVNERKVNRKIKLKPTHNYMSHFNSERDLLYAHDLVDAILELYRNNSPRYHQVKAFLQRELGEEPSTIKGGSLLEEGDPVIRIANYLQLFTRMQEKGVGCFVHIPCSGPKGTSMSNQLPDMIGRGAVVIGPSGCGKSLLTRWLSLAMIDRSVVPLLLEAKYYESDLNELVDRVVNMFGFESAIGFFQDARGAGRQVLLVLDGLNECAATKQLKLLTELERIALRYDANFLISTQSWKDQASKLNGIKLSVDFPSLEIKTAIAECDDSSMEPLLSVVATGLEARIIGEIKAAGPEQFSRFTLFETFVRRKLVTDEGTGYALLSRIACFLSEQITFSLSMRQVEGILQESGIQYSVLENAVGSGLVQRNGIRLSFQHEMLLNFFVAGAIVNSLAEPSAIIEALELPKNKGSRLLVLGAIEEPEMLHAVLGNLDDPELMLSACQGEAGLSAKAWMGNRLSLLLKELAVEVQAITFEVVGDEWHPVRVNIKTIRNWTPQESALLDTLSFLLATGQYIPETLNVIGVTDQVCARELRRLREEPREKPVAIRSGIFSALYVGMGKQKSGLTRVFSPLLSGVAAFFSKKAVPADAIALAVEQGPLSNGQLYLLLLICRYSDATQGLYPVLIDRLQNHWKYLPRHLRAQLIEQAPYACCSQQERVAMTAILNAIHTDTRDVWESTSLFEALSALGALDEDALAHVQTVENELTRLLADPLNEAYFGEAAGIFNAQFDHPYESAYQTAIDQLPVENKKLFYTMALQHRGDSIFLTSLIFNAASILEAAVCPLLIRFTSQPIVDEHMPQDSLAVFMWVHLLLAQFGASIESRLADEAHLRQKTLFACAELCFWLNRKDLTLEQRRQASKAALAVLFERENEYALEAIWQTEHALHMTDYKYYWQGRDLQLPAPIFGQQVAAVARKAVQYPEFAMGIFDDSDDKMPHAIDLLRRCGNQSDIPLLKQMAAHPAWGTSAVNAIRALEA